LQVVSIDSLGREFDLHEEALESIMCKVPVDMKVAVLAVVGAFRTGKSFLLSFFLRYLRMFDEGPDGTRRPLCAGPKQKNGRAPWIMADIPLGGDANDTRGDDGAEAIAASARAHIPSFSYRAGEERMTTGIWMWSRPFFLSLPQCKGERVAILLVDTQGMFDRRTGLSLTSSIFGLSTLLSSHQVYNLSGRVQEDHLHELALFTEYGRTAEAEERREERAGEVAPALRGTASIPRPPFQAVTLLIRNSDETMDADKYNSDEVDASHAHLVHEIMSESNTEDIARTRSSIRACFEEMFAFRLPHPGKAVTRPDFSGEVRHIDSDFLCAVEKFVDDMFTKHLLPKQVRHMDLTASDTLRYMRVYSKLFKEADVFPKLQNILDANAEANNHNAVTRALRRYTEEMQVELDRAGEDHIPPEQFQRHHEAASGASMRLFNSLATFGPDESIGASRDALASSIADKYRQFVELNTMRDPLHNFEYYVLPVIFGVVAYILRFVADMTCSPYIGVCKGASDFFGLIASLCLLVILVVVFVRGSAAYARFEKLFRYFAGPLGVATTKSLAESVVSRMASAAGGSSKPAEPTLPVAEEESSPSGLRRRARRTE
jgi:atlastin